MVVSTEALSEIQASVTQAQDGQLVQAMHKLMNALAKHGLVRTIQLRPDEVGRHPVVTPRRPCTCGRFVGGWVGLERDESNLWGNFRSRSCHGARIQ